MASAAERSQARESARAEIDRQWVAVPPQTCQVGCVPQDSECSDNERPRHSVRIAREFLLMATEVTVSAFRSYAAEAKMSMSEQPAWSGDDHPVVNVTWGEAAGFCRWSGGRLPTEAEWECAARGGVEGRIYPWGDRYEPGLANDSDGFRQSGTRTAGSYPPNAYGLYDMVGNAWEWVNDWFEDGYYSRSPSENPTGPAAGLSRVMRGGSWRPYPRVFRVSNRGRGQPDRTSYYVGFRCARDER
jgi:formylglycine-generating enzyme required for sulfatase activity